MSVLPPAFRHITLGNGIRAAALRVGDKPALRLGGETLGYRALTRRMARLANLGHEALGVRAGDRVALIAPNCLEYVELVAGLSDLGAIVATLSPRLTRAELASILADCEPAVIIVHPNCEVSLDPAWERDLRIVRLGQDYERLLERASDRAELPLIEEWAPFALAYTSGTTGAPKGVLLSHRSRALTFLAMAGEYRCFGQDDRFLALAPMCHGAGFAFACATLFFGGTTEMLNSGDPEALLRRLSAGDITGVFVVPTHLSRLFGLPQSTLDCHREHGLTAIISNAAALAQPLKEQAIAQFGEGVLHETYGSTEAGIVTNIRPADILRKPGSVGLPFAGMQVELRGESGTTVPPGAAGELFCRGPTGFNGYWRRPRDTAETIVGDWITVGDMGVLDEEGFLTLVDRKKDMVVTGGMNVFPSEIERVIAALPGVREVAVVGLPDEEWGERLHAFIVADGGRQASEEAIAFACRARLAGYKLPRGVTVLPELPRNAAGKVLKRELKALA